MALIREKLMSDSESALNQAVPEEEKFAQKVKPTTRKNQPNLEAEKSVQKVKPATESLWCGL